MKAVVDAAANNERRLGGVERHARIVVGDLRNLDCGAGLPLRRKSTGRATEALLFAVDLSHDGGPTVERTAADGADARLTRLEGSLGVVAEKAENHDQGEPDNS